MAIRRAHPSELHGFKGRSVYQWQVFYSVSVVAVGVTDYLELDPRDIFPPNKFGLVFINITSIGGTWRLRLYDQLRVGSTGTHRHLIQNQISVSGRTTTGKVELGWNAETGGNTLLGEKIVMEVECTFLSLGEGSLDFDGDVVFYN